MTLNDGVVALVIAGAVAFIVYCPIFKPYFGCWRPRATR